MSKRYIGGFISTSPPTAYTNSVTPGVWTLEEQIQRVYGNNWQFYPPGGFFQIDFLMVGGGGGGGYPYSGSVPGAAYATQTYTISGGGGGGGVVYAPSFQGFTANTYSIVIGSGGSRGASTGASGVGGGTTSISGYFYAAGNTTLVAQGGGGGGTGNQSGSSGGNGGGAGAAIGFGAAGGGYYAGYALGTSTTQPTANPTTAPFTNVQNFGFASKNGQEYAYNSTYSNMYSSGSGGGGAGGTSQMQGSVSSPAVSVPIGGGPGYYSAISGTGDYYGAGGPGCSMCYLTGLVSGSYTYYGNGYGSGGNGAVMYYTGFSTGANGSGVNGIMFLKYLQTTANISFSPSANVTITQSSPYNYVKITGNATMTVNAIFPYSTQQF